MKKVILRKNGSVSVQTINDEPSMTQQQFADEVDANNIIAKYNRTGEITHKARQAGVYADVSEIGDYKQSLEKVMAAQDAFETLPSQVRLRFNNNPEELINFLHDPKNYQEGISLGLYEKPPITQTPTQTQTQTTTTNPTNSSTQTAPITPEPSTKKLADS